ncbi:MAG: HD domain-containing protein, partial [Spirochaetaceae bacterium]|nr:HD domain-containing protein [Spirochaetaceae bacterium]
LLRTGLRIQILEGIEENQLTYLAVEHAIRDLKAEMARSNSLIIEVGAGTTDIILLHRGKVLAAHSLRLGTIRMEKHMNEEAAGYGQKEKSIRGIIRNAHDTLDAEFRLDRVKFFVAVGRSARLAAKNTATKTTDRYSIISKKKFLDFVDTIQKSTPEEIVRMFKTTYYNAEGLVPSLAVYKYFLEKTSAGRILVPEASLREGVMLSFALDTRVVKKRFLSQIMTAVISLGRKFRFDEKHGRHVAKISLSIFDQLAAEHGLDAHARVLLEAAAILHDIGSYLGSLHHERHGQYIVGNSEIFGFSPDDIKIISFIVRFHRKLSPHALPRGFASLSRGQRIRILKIAAILRIADALDKSHGQRILSLRLEKNQDEILLHAVYSGDSPLRESLWKSEMFEEVFGYKVHLA